MKINLSEKADEKNRRLQTRYTPSPNTMGSIFLQTPTDTAKANLLSLVFSRGMGGCGFFIMAPNPLKKGMNLFIKVGDGTPVKAEIRWIRQIEKNIMSVGVQFSNVKANLKESSAD